MEPEFDDIALARQADDGNPNFPDDSWDPWYWRADPTSVEIEIDVIPIVIET